MNPSTLDDSLDGILGKFAATINPTIDPNVLWKNEPFAKAKAALQTLIDEARIEEVTKFRRTLLDKNNWSEYSLERLSELKKGSGGDDG